MLKISLFKLAEDRVLTEQLRLILDNVKDSVLIVTGFYILMYWLYADKSNSLHILTWCITAATFRLYIAFYVRGLIASGIKVEQARQVAKRLIVLQGIDGTILGFIVYMVVMDGAHLLESMMLVVFLTAIIVISMSQYASVFMIFLVRAAPIAIPLVGKLLLANNNILQAVGTVGVFCAIFIFIYGKRSYLATYASINLSFENIELVEKLRIEKEHTQVLLRKAEQARQEADQANTSKSKFLAAASHDLRQPLHALSLFTSVLDGLAQSPKIRTVVDQINSSVDALQSLFNALLDISQLDAGVMKVEKVDFNLQPLFNKLSNDFDTLASQKGLHITWPTESYAVHSDPMLFEQILRNFISNALRYTEQGNITINCLMKDGLIRTEVTDTGIGIPEDEQEIIFEEFHQLNNVERDRSKGLGLGLAIVQRAAKLLEHTIDVVSQPGNGSTFSIEVRQAIMTEPPALSSNVVEEDIAPEVNTLMVVIDDEKNIREATKSLFEQWNCDVVCAANMEDAIAQLKQLDRLPNGIISDYRLSDTQTGIEAIHAIFAAFNITIPALIVSGDIAIESLRNVNSSNFQMLHKPVATLKLRTFLRHVQLHKLKQVA